MGAMEGLCIGYGVCYAIRDSGAVGDVMGSCGYKAKACGCAAAYGRSFCDVSSSYLTF